MVDYLQTLVEDGQQDVDGFWRGLVAAEPGPVKQFARASPAVYTSPRRVAFLADSTPTPCGVIAADNAHYCSGDSTVYLGRAFFLGELSLGGNFLPILILSHEWGHHIQNILDLNPLGIPRSLNSTNIELQADCFAGLYAADAARRGPGSGRRGGSGQQSLSCEGPSQVSLVYRGGARDRRRTDRGLALRATARAGRLPGPDVR